MQWFLFGIIFVIIIIILLLTLAPLQISIPLSILLGLLDLYFILKYREHSIKQDVISKADFPPKQYMKLTGGKCPDMWSVTGIDANGNYICENKLNIPINKCSSKQVFTTLDNYPLTTVDEQKKVLHTAVEGGMSRCQFIKECGIKENMPASWIGIDNLC